jgi:hypothetical protein
MSKRDELAVAELAALVGGSLNEVDTNMIDPSSSGRASKIHPSQFITSNKSTNRPTTQRIQTNMMEKEPVSRHTGSEVIGVEEVDLRSLIIPYDGADDKMKEAIAAHANTSPAPIKPPVAPPVVPPVAPPVAQTARQAVNNTEITIVELLQDINSKLDILLKRAKIQPRYKRNKNGQKN